jgi:hypothetical protein
MRNVGQKDNKKLVAESQVSSETSSGNRQKQKIDSEKDDYGHTQESVDIMIARAIRRRFTDVLDFVFFHSSAEIKKINIERDYLRLIVDVPFALPEPSGGGKWWDTAAAQNALRRDFAKHLTSGRFKKTFGNLFYTELAHFLLKRENIGRYRKDIQTRLRKLPQQKLAGRPSHPIGKSVANEITNDGVKIHQALEKMQKTIGRWKDNDPKIDDPAIEKKLSRSYPVKSYPWMSLFHELIPKLPCKPYFDSKGKTTEILDENDQPLPAKLCEPDRWSTIVIAVKVLQTNLLHTRGIKFPLRGIRQVLAKALPQVNN